MTSPRPVRDDQHGTNTGYAYGCRCYACCAASRAYHRAYVSTHRDQRNASKREARRRESADTFSRHASADEVRLWANSIGLTLPRAGRARDLLIDRFNREHPDRQYLRPSERSA